MNTSVCLSSQGSDISMSLRLSFYESLQLVVRSLDTQRRRARARGGEARGGGGGESGCLRTTMYFIYDRVHGHFLAARRRSVRQNSKGKKKKNGISSRECLGWLAQKFKMTPTLAPSFRIIKVNVIREGREHSFSQDNMENFTAFIPS